MEGEKRKREERYQIHKSPDTNPSPKLHSAVFAAGVPPRG